MNVAKKLTGFDKRFFGTVTESLFSFCISEAYSV